MDDGERVRLLRTLVIEVADPFSVEARACIQAYFQELRTRLEGGFDPALSVSADPEELLPPLGWLLIARLGVPGQDVGSGEPG